MTNDNNKNNGTSGKKSKRSVTEIDRLIGSSIRERRVSLGLSQQDLAMKIDVSFQQIQKYENGSNRITVARLFEISKILHCDTSYFFDRIEGQQSRVSEALRDSGVVDIELSTDFESVGDAPSDREVLDLTKIFKSVKSRRLRNTFVNFLRAIADEDKGKKS